MKVNSYIYIYIYHVTEMYVPNKLYFTNNLPTLLQRFLNIVFQCQIVAGNNWK